MSRRGIATLLIGAAIAAPSASPQTASGDLIVLKDGRTLSGTLTRRGDDMIIKTDAASGSQTIVTTNDQIVRITLTDSLTPAQLAESEWNRISVQIKRADDLAAILGLHKKFIEKHPKAEVTASVKTSMGEYEKLEKQRAVKFRGRWMPAEQVNVTLKTWQDNARPAVELYRSGKVKESFESAKKILLADGDNPIALTTAGLAAFRLNNLIASRMYFTKLAAADPGSPLAENNLGVIATQQRNLAESLLHYARAIQSGPGNRLVLDNAVEAIAAFNASGGDQKSAAYKDLVRQFEQAEARMQAEMAKQNLFRYGSTWVSKEDRAKLGATNAQVQAAMKDLDAQYATAKQNVAAVNEQINQLNNDYNTTLANINAYNAIIANAGRGRESVDVLTAVTQRDIWMQNLQTIRAKKSEMEFARDQLNLSIQNMFAAAGGLKAANANTGGQILGVQRMMELGEDQTPPPPAPLEPQRVVVNLPPVPAPAPPVAGGQGRDYTDDLLDNYSIVGGAIGFPVFPGAPPRGGRPRHGGHGGHGGGHGGNSGKPPVVSPTVPGVYPGPVVVPGNTGAPAVIPGRPGGVRPGTPVVTPGTPVVTPGTPGMGTPGTQPGGPGKPPVKPPVVGTPGVPSVTPGPKPTPGGGGAETRPAPRTPDDPTKAVPQGGPGSPFSNQKPK